MCVLGIKLNPVIGLLFCKSVEFRLTSSSPLFSDPFYFG